MNPGSDPTPQRFHEIQRAFEAIVGSPELTIEPIAGEWWRLSGFTNPDRARRSAVAVTGIRFEITEPQRVPLREATDEVRISYAGEAVSLPVRYAGSRFAPPLLRARFAALAEPMILTLLCLAIVPVIAVVLALEIYVLSDLNDLLTWASALLTVGLGYGALAAALVSTGRSVPHPRRAVMRTRSAVAELLAALHRSPS